jgi:hypothetical protein
VVAGPQHPHGEGDRTALAGAQVRRDRRLQAGLEASVARRGIGHAAAVGERRAQLREPPLQVPGLRGQITRHGDPAA